MYNLNFNVVINYIVIILYLLSIIIFIYNLDAVLLIINSIILYCRMVLNNFG